MLQWLAGCRFQVYSCLLPYNLANAVQGLETVYSTLEFQGLIQILQDQSQWFGLTRKLLHYRFANRVTVQQTEQPSAILHHVLYLYLKESSFMTKCFKLQYMKADFFGNFLSFTLLLVP